MSVSETDRSRENSARKIHDIATQVFRRAEKVEGRAFWLEALAIPAGIFLGVALQTPLAPYIAVNILPVAAALYRNAVAKTMRDDFEQAVKNQNLDFNEKARLRPIKQQMDAVRPFDVVNALSPFVRIRENPVRTVITALAILKAQPFLFGAVALLASGDDSNRNKNIMKESYAIARDTEMPPPPASPQPGALQA